MSKKWTLSLFFILCTAVLASAWALRSQQNTTREKRPPKPGTLRALVEKPGASGDIQLGLEVDYPTFSSLDKLAEASDAVVRGVVTASGSIPCNYEEFLCTQFRVRVLEVLWGAVPEGRRGKDRVRTLTPAKAPQFLGPGLDELVVTQSGGTLSMNGKRVRAWVMDEKLLQVNSEYVLFLTWVAPERRTTLGSDTYALTGGPQGAIEIQGEQARSTLGERFTDHPLRLEVERVLNGSTQLIRSHFEALRLGRRP